MGKRYHCDYCDKTMVAAPSIVRTHSNGLIHQRFVSEHYQQFKDPETILSEESKKKPCNRYITGTCQFGSLCHFSHYSPEQISYLRECVAEKKRRLENNSEPSLAVLYNKMQEEKSLKTSVNEDLTILCDDSGITHTLPWTYNSEFDRIEQLPPSLKRFTIDDFAHADIREWGGI